MQKSKSKHLGYGNVAQIYFRKRGAGYGSKCHNINREDAGGARISSTSEKITEEINDCIAACKADLANDGVNRIDEKDGLIIRAVTLYCKAEFGYNNNAEKFRNSYDTLKMRLSMSQEYNTPIVSETDTVGGESGG